MSEELQESQKQAIQKNELPEGVRLNEPAPFEDYAKENEQVKDKLAEFGETDLEHFMSKVQSNAVYGKQILRRLLGLDGDTPYVDPQHKTSPQEKNITGSLDHSTFPPKLKGKPEQPCEQENDAA